MNGTQFGFAVTFFTTAFVIICYYFDRLRHQDPHFRKKLKQNREKLRSVMMRSLISIRDLEKSEDKEVVILKEIGVAEKLMTKQNYDKAVIHFANAIIACVDPHNLLSALERSLPPEVYDLLIYVLVTNYGKHFVKFQGDHRIKKLLHNQSYHSP